MIVKRRRIFSRRLSLAARRESTAGRSACKQGLNRAVRSPSLSPMRNIAARAALPPARLIAGLAALALLTTPLSACKRVNGSDADRAETARAYPPASRPVSDLAGNQWSTETARDKRGEAEEIMKAAGLQPGMTVADIGAGEGYYTVRLAEKVGKKGRVLAQDIDRAAIDRLAERVNRESLDNVSIKLGAADDPRLWHRGTGDPRRRGIFRRSRPGLRRGLDGGRGALADGQGIRENRR